MKIKIKYENLHIPSWGWSHSVDVPVSSADQAYDISGSFPNRAIFPIDDESEK